MALHNSDDKLKKNGEQISGKPVDTAGSIFVQIYEIQTPEEAEVMIGLGVDRMGSVVLSVEEWKDAILRETIRLREKTPVKSCLIPLFSDPDMVYRTADYYAPDIIHFCESLIDDGLGGKKQEISKDIGRFIELQEGFKKRFPEIDIMRAVPVAREGRGSEVPSLEIAGIFEPVSDFFLIDTVLLPDNENVGSVQPESGFVGITGKTCDWETAGELVKQSALPVILAGGISPDNVYDGIIDVLPAGVDSCTKTNAVDGGGNAIRFKKDPEKVKRLISAVRRAEKEIRISPENR
jgi:phosphoribosylanthranilate isomerase